MRSVPPSTSTTNGARTPDVMSTRTIGESLASDASAVIDTAAIGTGNVASSGPIVEKPSQRLNGPGWIDLPSRFRGIASLGNASRNPVAENSASRFAYAIDGHGNRQLSPPSGLQSSGISDAGSVHAHSAPSKS